MMIEDDGERHEVRAAPEMVGMRLDRVLRDALPVLSRTRIKALLESGQVEMNAGAIVDPAYRVKAGDRFTLHVPPAEAAEPEPQPMPLLIVFEDDHLIVIDKPAGLVVHPAPGNADATLVNALLAHCGDSLSGIGGVRRPGIVHRLDKDTSGLLVVAKTDVAHAGLAAQFAAHSIRRVYHAVVWGVPLPRAGRIEGNIGRSRQNRKKMAVIATGGKPAVTNYRVVAAYGNAAAQVECRLETGRTHQIRVHLANRGHPLIGDTAYGRSTPARLRALGLAAAEAVRGFPRQALHAALLGFDHPVDDESLLFESALPNDINELIRNLESVEFSV